MDEQRDVTEVRRYLLTYLHRQNTIHTVEVSIPIHGTQDPMSWAEGAAWKAGDKLVETIHPVKLYDLSRIRITRME